MKTVPLTRGEGRQTIKGDADSFPPQKGKNYSFGTMKRKSRAVLAQEKTRNGGGGGEKKGRWHTAIKNNPTEKDTP